ncbi:MAG: hypothetical protein K2H85_08015 [Allobaculum sp.]|nr:hypothetical protein [Allobaculum sp.]
MKRLSRMTEQEILFRLTKHAQNNITKIEISSEAVTITFRNGMGSWYDKASSMDACSTFTAKTLAEIKEATSKKYLLSVNVQLSFEDIAEMDKEEKESGMSDKRLSAVVKRLEIVRTEKERLANEEKALQEMIINEMIIRDTDTIDVNGHRITSKTVKSTHFDTKAFKVEYADLYNRYLFHGFQTRFNFK